MLPISDFERMLDRIDMLMVRESTGGKNLSPKMCFWIGRVMYGGYLLFPSQQEIDCLVPFVNPDDTDRP